MIPIVTTLADLHLHSDCSDGTLDPDALVRHVAACGVGLLALTDHDTLAGCETAARACAQAGVRFVAGVEVSTEWRGQSIHVIALAPRAQDAGLDAHLDDIRTRRRARILAIGERLERRARLPGTEIARLILERHAVPTRVHVARALVERGDVADVQLAFDRWLGRGRDAHVPVDWPALPQTLGVLDAAGATTVLAHPHRYRLSGGALRALVDEFAADGGGALEVSVAGMARHDLDRVATLARRARLAGSCGSDFHDPRVPWNTPGRFAKLPADIEPVAGRFVA
jgi:predicted metal-dependent phosphoesterase TrpH